MAMRYRVEYRHGYTDKEPVITCFDDAEAALSHAGGYLAAPVAAPHYMLRIRDCETSEVLTYAQLDFRLNGGLVSR
jgi:hypothetical protein